MWYVKVYEVLSPKGILNKNSLFDSMTHGIKDILMNARKSICECVDRGKLGCEVNDKFHAINLVDIEYILNNLAKDPLRLSNLFTIISKVYFYHNTFRGKNDERYNSVLRTLHKLNEEQLTIDYTDLYSLHPSLSKVIYDLVYTNPLDLLAVLELINYAYCNNTHKDEWAFVDECLCDFNTIDIDSLTEEQLWEHNESIESYLTNQNA